MSTEPNDGKKKDDEELKQRQLSLANKALHEFNRLRANPFINSDTALLKEIDDFEKKLHDPEYLLDDPEIVKKDFSDLKTKIKSKMVAADQIIQTVENELTKKAMDRKKTLETLDDYDNKAIQQFNQIESSIQKLKNADKLDAVNQTLQSCRSQFQAVETLLKPYQTIGGRFQRIIMRNKKKIDEYHLLNEQLTLLAYTITSLKAYSLELISAPDSKFPKMTHDDDRMIELKKTFELIESHYYLSGLKQRDSVFAAGTKHKDIVRADLLKSRSESDVLKGQLKQLNNDRELLKESLSSLNLSTLGSKLQIGVQRRH